MPDRYRVRILCEDRRTERFLRRLCERYGIWVLESDVAPDGRGDASVWVRKRYVSWVKKLRARRHQQRLGLIVAIDGDNKGVPSRKVELDAELADAGVSPRDKNEAIVVFVPTWCIETWLALLCLGSSVVETESLKNHPAYRQLWENGKVEAETIAAAVRAWRGDTDPCPSLADGYLEAGRVGV